MHIFNNGGVSIKHNPQNWGPMATNIVISSLKCLAGCDGFSIIALSRIVFLCFCCLLMIQELSFVHTFPKLTWCSQEFQQIIGTYWYKEWQPAVNRWTYLLFLLDVWMHCEFPGLNPFNSWLLPRMSHSGWRWLIRVAMLLCGHYKRKTSWFLTIQVL